uniref:Uncharacterized protein n=1 Tax=Peronospora matthiolae TaxID=2874970 RepID=A0AAV1U7B3_9STRA
MQRIEQIKSRFSHSQLDGGQTLAAIVDLLCRFFGKAKAKDKMVELLCAVAGIAITMHSVRLFYARFSP